MQSTQELKSSQKVVRRGGLSGKARRNRKRGRAARLRSQEWIDECLAPEQEADDTERFIPIGTCNEFHPSVATGEAAMSCKENDHTRERQLTLTLSSDSQHDASVETDSLKERGDRAIRLGADLSRLSIPMKRASRDFSIRGFAMGCAMGGAAAATVLVMIRTAIG